jgi:hypothetical protein
MEDVERHYAEFDLGEQPVQFSWDDKKAGFQVRINFVLN